MHIWQLILISVLIFRTPLLHSQSFEEDLYKTKYTRLQTLYVMHIDSTTSPQIITTVDDLIELAEETAQENDYSTAAILVDQARKTLTKIIMPDKAIQQPESDTFSTFAIPSKKYLWNNTIYSGLDYSKFDSTGDYVPFAKFENDVTFSLNKTTELDISTLADYKHEKQLAVNVNTGLYSKIGGFVIDINNDVLRQNELDSTLDNFTENTFELELQFNLNPRFSIVNINNLFVKYYDKEREENNSYNYVTNWNKTHVLLNWPNGLNIVFRENHEYRFSKIDKENNYNEFTMEGYLNKYFKVENSFTMENSFVRRSYHNPFDTTIVAQDTTFSYNDYFENFFYMDVSYKLFRILRTKFVSSIDLREYDVNTEYTPNTLLIKLSPGVIWNMTDFLSLGTNTFYERLTNTAKNTSEAKKDDYYSYAAEISIDYFNIGKIFFSVSDKFEIKEFPHASQSDTVYSINQDNYINSLIMFSTYSLSEKIDVTFSVFWDTEIPISTENNTDIVDSDFFTISAGINYRF